MRHPRRHAARAGRDPLSRRRLPRRRVRRLLRRVAAGRRAPPPREPRHRVAVDRRGVRRAAAAARPRSAGRDRSSGFSRACAALGFDASCGVARSKLVARIASQLGRPRGVVHVLDGYEARFLSPLKIEMLPGIDPALAAPAARGGHPPARPDREAVGAAAVAARRPRRHARSPARPRASTPAGSAARRCRRRASRSSSSPRRARTPRRSMPRLRAEAERLGRELRSRGVFARTLTLRLRFADGRVDSRTPPLTRADGARRCAAGRRAGAAAAPLDRRTPRPRGRRLLRRASSPAPATRAFSGARPPTTVSAR